MIAKSKGGNGQFRNKARVAVLKMGMTLQLTAGRLIRRSWGRKNQKERGALGLLSAVKNKKENLWRALKKGGKRRAKFGYKAKMDLWAAVSSRRWDFQSRRSQGFWKKKRYSKRNPAWSMT